MIERNLFRPLAKINTSLLRTEQDIELLKADIGGSTDFVQEMDPAWPHLKPIYALLLKICDSDKISVRSCKLFVSPRFINQLIQLFDTKVPEEACALVACLKTIYSKVSESSEDLTSMVCSYSS